MMELGGPVFESGYFLALASYVPLAFEHMAFDQFQVSPEQCRAK